MNVYDGLNDLPNLNAPVVTVGSFDGLHKGHRFLLDILKERAAVTGGESTVVTFGAHPRLVLSKEKSLKLLTVRDEKIILLSEIGIDNVVIIPFDEQFSRISAQCFVEDILIGAIGARSMVVGYDHHFGHDRIGDFGFLENIRKKFGFEIFEAPEFDCEGLKVNSTEIRNAIRQGEMDSAARLLGYRYMVLVCKNDEGIITPVSEQKLLPPDGTYRAEVFGKHHTVKISDGAICFPSGIWVPNTEAFIITF